MSCFYIFSKAITVIECNNVTGRAAMEEEPKVVLKVEVEVSWKSGSFLGWFETLHKSSMQTHVFPLSEQDKFWEGSKSSEKASEILNGL